MSKQKPKTGMGRMMQLAMTKKPLVIASVILSSLAAVASFIPYCNLFYYPADFSRISEPERIGTDQPVFLWLDGTGRRCGEYSSVFCSPYVFPSGGFRHAI